MTVSWKDQLALARPDMCLRDNVAVMNRIVVPCPPKPRIFGLIPRKRHRMVDYTSCVNTGTYSILERCEDCGYLVVSSGL